MRFIEVEPTASHLNKGATFDKVYLCECDHGHWFVVTPRSGCPVCTLQADQSVDWVGRYQEHLGALRIELKAERQRGDALRTRLKAIDRIIAPMEYTTSPVLVDHELLNEARALAHLD